MLLQKTNSTVASQIKNDGLMYRYLYTGIHEAIITDEVLTAVQQEKFSRSKEPQNQAVFQVAYFGGVFCVLICTLRVFPNRSKQFGFTSYLSKQ